MKGDTADSTDTTDTDGTDEHSEGNDVEEEVNIAEDSTTRERLVILLTQAGPVTASFFLGFAGTFTNLIFASHFIGDDGSKSTVFAGISLANMFANVSCMSLLIGMFYSFFLILHTPPDILMHYLLLNISVSRCHHMSYNIITIITLIVIINLIITSNMFLCSAIYAMALLYPL
jgi:hypothetical protein